MAHNATTQKVIEIVRKKGMLRPRELDRHGIPRVYLSRLCERGLLQRINRGLYTLPEAEQTEHHTLAEACKRVPNGVLCLLSALRFHQITTQAPFEIWLALKGTTWHPKIDRPRIRFVRFSGPAFDTGIDRYKIEGVSIKVYNPAKTVADCFKYRNKIGLDVAIEALRECRRDSKCTNDELWEYAKVCRVSKVMKPYMEAMV
ncbi:MAG: type IV toxin-antitoxin system AbiEi family antitoxin domain-containing protein [Deltaproteobacteria bacterium]|jgi:predicted transcriptional regulator of viral defense system|nr:type IV toxin-antitoxin system AbiEi family antitoxin domain-containing protein [Deltaproteobacteria bacterium]